MTSVITQTFAELRKNGKKALIPFITAGYPNRGMFGDLLKTIEGAGADFIEIGIPFSDPMADGKTIQDSSHVALSNGITVDRIFDMIFSLNGFKTPLIIMSYINPILSYTPEKFFADASRAGVHGIIIPDLIPDEVTGIEGLSRNFNIDLIYLLAPTSGPGRTEMILRRSRGFVYLVTIAGVTGSRRKLPDSIYSWISQVKSVTDKPICAGFGISNAKQAYRISRLADGIIVGSALIDQIALSTTKRTVLRNVTRFVGQLRKGMDNE